MSSTLTSVPFRSLFNGSLSNFELKTKFKTNATPRMAQIKTLNMKADETNSSTPSTIDSSKIDTSFGLGRRNLIGLSSVLLFNSVEFGQQAWAAPKGYKTLTDNVDNYSFVYPFGWQEVLVKGLDIVLKDVIEPLESVSVNIIKTEKEDLSEFGPPQEVSVALVEKVLTNPGQKSKVLSSRERITDGKKYYTFEFVVEYPNYTRHALATVAIGYGKFYTLVTGANERRWSKLADKLDEVANSFVLL